MKTVLVNGFFSFVLLTALFFIFSHAPTMPPSVRPNEPPEAVALGSSTESIGDVTLPIPQEVPTTNVETVPSSAAPSSFSPGSFRGPSGPPSIIGPKSNPPDY